MCFIPVSINTYFALYSIDTCFDFDVYLWYTCVSVTKQYNLIVMLGNWGGTSSLPPALTHLLRDRIQLI